jgi:hypothetical protein
MGNILNQPLLRNLVNFFCEVEKKWLFYILYQQPLWSKGQNPTQFFLKSFGEKIRQMLFLCLVIMAIADNRLKSINNNVYQANPTKTVK